nr:integrase, catalytic region, zinc finger, CCHC-type, peptidase aspartic, catalytic [Tanacetum cinerariifolium]
MTAKDLWDALARHMLGSEYGEQDRKAVKCGYSKDNCELNFKLLNNLQPEWKQYGTMMRQNKNLMDINIDALYNILKQNQRDVNDAMGSKKETVVVTSDPLALIAKKTKVSKKGSEADDFSELKKITALLAKAFNRRKFYSKPTNNNLRTSSTSQVKCYNCKKERHFAKDCKKVKVKDYEYYKKKMLLAKKDKDEQVLLAKDQVWMESSSDSDQEINANMVFMAQIEKVLSNSKASSSSADEKISEVSYYLSESESESEFETSEYYDNSTNYGLFVNNDDEQEIFHDAIESASENFIENHIYSQKDYDKSDVYHIDFEEKDHLVDKLIRKFIKKIVKCQNCIEKANQQSKDFKNQNKDLQDKYDVLKNQTTTFEINDKELNEQLKELIEKNNDFLLKQRKGIGFENLSYFKKAKDLRSTLYDEKVIDLDTFSSVRRPKNSSVIWKKKGSSNISNVGETSSAYMCNDAMNVSCDSKMNDLFDDNNFFIFDDVNVRISPISKMPFRKKPRDSMNIIQICLWIIDLGCSKHMTGNRALLTNFVEKFLETVRFGNNDFDVIAGYEDVVIGPMTIKKVYYVEGLGHNLFSVGQFSDNGLEVTFRKSTCFVRNEDAVDLLTGDRSSNFYTIALNEVASNSSTCFLAKASSSQSWLWHQRLSHLNFATINNLVKNNFVQVQRVRIDNGTEFKKKTLAKFFDTVGITQQFSAARTPQQNGVEERRNRTLIKAARTMLTFVNLPSFLWTEAIATACFIQNHSIIHKRFDKTPYELINKRKPNINFFREFECRCYLLNDYEDVGKHKAKEDIGVFVGYSKESVAFRIYNKRTRKIHESVNVNFDEISEIASKQFSLEPGLSNLNKTGKSSNPSVSQVSEASKKI